ncbi:MAG: nucleotidyltransferase domain-containing protein [Microgenomates group bacterium]
MSKTLIDILIEEAWEKEKYFKNYLRYARKIKKEAEKLLGKSRVFVFGSVLKKDEVPRDIDVLIVSPKIKKGFPRGKTLAKIWEKIGFASPFEIHFASPSDYQNWYRFFLKGAKEI